MGRRLCTLILNCNVLERIKEQARAHQRAAESALSHSTNKYTKKSAAHFCNACQGMVWNGMEDDFSIFHTDNFLPFHFHSILKIFHFIFHSILKFSSIFHSILPYQKNFRLEAMQRTFWCFASL